MRRRGLSGAGLLAVVGLALAACGSGEDSNREQKLNPPLRSIEDVVRTTNTENGHSSPSNLSARPPSSITLIPDYDKCSPGQRKLVDCSLESISSVPCVPKAVAVCNDYGYFDEGECNQHTNLTSSFRNLIGGRVTSSYVTASDSQNVVYTAIYADRLSASTIYEIDLQTLEFSPLTSGRGKIRQSGRFLVFKLDREDLQSYSVNLYDLETQEERAILESTLDSNIDLNMDIAGDLTALGEVISTTGVADQGTTIYTYKISEGNSSSRHYDHLLTNVVVWNNSVFYLEHFDHVKRQIKALTPAGNDILIYDSGDLNPVETFDVSDNGAIVISYKDGRSGSYVLTEGSLDLSVSPQLLNSRSVGTLVGKPAWMDAREDQFAFASSTDSERSLYARIQNELAPISVGNGLIYPNNPSLSQEGVIFTQQVSIPRQEWDLFYCIFQQ